MKNAIQAGFGNRMRKLSGHVVEDVLSEEATLEQTLKGCEGVSR